MRLMKKSVSMSRPPPKVPKSLRYMSGMVHHLGRYLALWLQMDGTTSQHHISQVGLTIYRSVTMSVQMRGLNPLGT